MSINNSLRYAVRGVLLASGAAAGIGVSAAQTAGQTIQEVVVTGSRLSSPNMRSISPVTAISADSIAVTGKVRVEDIVNQLPQAMAAQGSTISNGSTGTATVDLRGLNAKRTLVLINGRRLMPGNPDSAPAANSGASDLNQIPQALIERVEVLTGGASSVYGADAVAGVVNFIMNTRFEGVMAEVNYSFYNHDNDNPVADIVRAKGYDLPGSSVDTGFTRDFSLVLGANFSEDRGNATFYATYRDVEEILQGEYDYSACSFNSGNAFSCGGSGTTNPTRMQLRDPLTGELADNLILNADGSMRPYDAAADAYNFGPLNFYQRPDERYTAGVFLDLDVAAGHSAYGEFMFMKDRSVAQIAPSGVFGQEFTIPCNNPFFSAEQQQVFCTDFGKSVAPESVDTVNILLGKRNVEGGPRRNDITHESYRAVFGLRGDLTPAWTYDAYGQFGQTELAGLTSNDFSITRIGRALDVVLDGDGNPVCRSFRTDPACVPYNPWQPGGITQQQIDYLQIPLVIKGNTTERIMNASVTGDLTDYGWTLPMALSGVLVNFGVEWRSEESELTPDLALQSGDGAGQGGPTTPVMGGYEARDLFTEVRVPLIEARPFAESLSGEIGYRYSDYDLGFSTDTYKLGMEWTPVQSIRARASYQRSVRVPNVTELYGVQALGLDGTIDLCASNVTKGELPALSPEQCARTGVAPGQYGRIQENSSSQYNGFIGGNPKLRPEQADTYSLGIGLLPEFAPGLRLQFDYFGIDIEDAIQNPNADFTLLLCARDGDPATCARVHRDRDGSLFQSNDGYIIDTFENIGSIKTSGFDFEAAYTVDAGNAGRVGLSFVGTLLDSLEFSPQRGVSYDCAGLYGSICGVPAPKWRHKLDANWRTPWAGIDVTLSWRYFDAVKRDAEDSNEFLSFLGQVDGAKATDAELGSRTYIDVTGSVMLAERYTVRLGVNNLFDKDPPLNGSTSCPTGPCNGNTWPQVYDSLGRQFFGLVSVEF